VLLVAGDSLAAQAVNGSAHPLLWAARKGAFDVDYDHRRHNLGVGSTTTDADAAPIAVIGSPASESVRRGLIHPERIARDTGYVTATGAKALLLEAGGRLDYLHPCLPWACRLSAGKRSRPGQAPDQLIRRLQW
jgi:hypothetical protein